MRMFLKDEIRNELAELEQDELNERLAGAEPAPITALPALEECTQHIYCYLFS